MQDLNYYKRVIHDILVHGGGGSGCFPQCKRGGEIPNCVVDFLHHLCVMIEEVSSRKLR